MLMLSFSLRLRLPDRLFFSGVPTEILYIINFQRMRATYPVHLFYFVLMAIIILTRSKSYEAPQKAVCSNCVLCSYSEVQIFYHHPVVESLGLF